MGESVEVNIEFHGPFRVATGSGRPGVDATIDPDDPLTASSLKGRMRAEAEVIGIRSELVEEVFGSHRSAGLWSWSRVEYPEGFLVTDRTRIRISPDTGTVERGAMLVAEEVWARGATFTIDLIGAADSARVEEHKAVLALSARLVRSVGSSRRRGLGWATFTVPGVVLKPMRVRALVNGGRS